MKIFLLVSCISLTCLGGFGQSIFGKWKTIDDETGKPKSVVEIYEKDGKAYGKVLELFREPHEDQDPYCDKCEDDRKDQRVIGMDIIRALESDDEEWEDGTICDPKNGKIYDCKLWVDKDDSNILQVRGYIYFFFRTQTWERVD
jgi:uncharacterized protein (DUF2147 family)